jgi:hypothetical protein
MSMLRDDYDAALRYLDRMRFQHVSASRCGASLGLAEHRARSMLRRLEASGLAASADGIGYVITLKGRERVR